MNANIKTKDGVVAVRGGQIVAHPWYHFSPEFRDGKLFQPAHRVGGDRDHKGFRRNRDTSEFVAETEIEIISIETLTDSQLADERLAQERNILAGRLNSLLADFAFDPSERLENEILALGRVLGMSDNALQIELSNALEGAE